MNNCVSEIMCVTYPLPDFACQTRSDDSDNKNEDYKTSDDDDDDDVVIDVAEPGLCKNIRNTEMSSIQTHLSFGKPAFVKSQMSNTAVLSQRFSGT